MVQNYLIMEPGSKEDLEKGFEWALKNLRGIYRTNRFRFHEKLLEWNRENGLSITIEGTALILERVTEAIEGEFEAEHSIELHTWEDIESLKFPDNPWRIKGLLPLEGFVILAGVSGEGKSFVSLEMANALTTPRPFLGEDRFSVIGTNVLYIDGEMSKSELQRRGKQMGFPDKRTFELYFVNQDDVNLNDVERDDLDEIMEIVTEKNVGVVFVDTLRAVAGGLEENRAEEVRKFFNRFKPLKDMGVCVVFLDHLRKGFGPKRSEPQKDNLLASQDKTASVEGLLMLQKKPGDGTITVFQRKNRLGEEMQPFDIWMYDTHMDPKQSQTKLEYGGEYNGNESKLEQAKEIIMGALKTADHSRQELIRIVEDDADIGSRTIQDALKSLHKSKQVDVKTDKRKHIYTSNTPKPPETGVLIKE